MNSKIVRKIEKLNVEINKTRKQINCVEMATEHPDFPSGFLQAIKDSLSNMIVERIFLINMLFDDEIDSENGFGEHESIAKSLFCAMMTGDVFRIDKLNDTDYGYIYGLEFYSPRKFFVLRLTSEALESNVYRNGSYLDFWREAVIGCDILEEIKEELGE
jgi:hypothetical protein